MDQERSEVIVTPRYLSVSTWMMRVPSMQNDKLGGKRLWEMSMNLVLAGFNFRPQSESQFVTMLIPIEGQWHHYVMLYNKMSSA